MILSRLEFWGRIKYDTASQEFTYTQNKAFTEFPYVRKPVVLNCDLTLDCNMRCRHCVAHDMRRYCSANLEVSPHLIEKINKSPFMTIVITGGEPLLTEFEEPLVRLISGLKRKGIMVDTNGCIKPSDRVLRTFINKRVLLRVSLDSLRMRDEVKLRMKRECRYPWNDRVTRLAYENKCSLIPKLVNFGINVGIQTVLHKRNFVSILDIILQMFLPGLENFIILIY